MLLGIVPGLVLAAAPSLFIYGSIFQIFAQGLELHTGPKRLALAVAIALVSTSAALIANQSVYKSAAALKALDVAASAPIEAGATVALLFHEPWAPRYSRPPCGEVCETLLYNGRVRRVMIGLATNAFGELPNSDSLVTYTIEKRASCEIQTTGQGGNAVAIRMRAGARLPSNFARCSRSVLMRRSMSSPS